MDKTLLAVLSIICGIATGCADTLPEPGEWQFGETASGADDVDSADGGRFAAAPLDAPTCEPIRPAMQLVSVQGAVAVDGMEATEDPAWWSALFTDTQTGADYLAAIEEHDDAMTFELELPAANYDVALRSSQLRGCDYSCEIPIGRYLLDDSPRMLDLRAALVPVEGSLTVDGSPPFDGGSAIRFRERSRGTVFTADLDPNAEFALTLPKGTYAASWTASGRDPQGDPPIGVADLGMHDVAGAAVLELDARTVRVDAELRVAGETMPDDSLLDGEPRAWVEFARYDDWIGQWGVSIGERGAAVFSRRIFPGDYIVTLQTEDASRQTALVPSHSVSLCHGEACRVSGSGPWQIELGDWFAQPHATLRGRIDLSGTFDDYDCRAGRISFLARRWPIATAAPGVTIVDDARRSGYPYSWSTAVAPDGSFEVQLPRGEYETLLRRGRWDCADPRIARGATTLGDVSLDGPSDEVQLTEPAGRLSGEVTVNGEAMPDNSLSGDLRGVLELHHRGGGLVVDLPLGASGPATFSTPLLPGSYDVRIVTEIFGRIPVPYVQDVLPPGERQLGTVQVHVGETTELNLDLEIAPLRDVVRVEGARDLDELLDGRAIAARLTDLASGAQFDYALDHEFAFDGAAYPGTYDVRVTERDDAFPTVRGLPFGATLVSECYPVP